MILIVVPVSLTLQAILRPFLRKKFAALKIKYAAPSGSGSERMSLHE
jgi:hypothetical protein